MTLEEYILSRSALPKNGTYTVLEHIQAMVLSTTSTCVGKVVKDTKVVSLSVSESTTGITVGEEVANIVVDVKDNDSLVSVDLIKVEINEQ